MSDDGPQTGDSTTRAEPPGVPRWVKGLGIGLVVLVALVVVVTLLTGVHHGPGMHG